MTHKLPREQDTGKLSAYAWPGGYDILYLDHENNVLCADCANQADLDRADWPNQAPTDYFLLQDTDIQGEWCSECNKHIGNQDDEPSTKEQYTVDLYVCFVADGYVYGASDNDNAAHETYWQPYYQDEPFTVCLYKRVPKDLADKLIDHGTSKQYFSDGYDAQNTLASYNLDSTEVLEWEPEPEEGDMYEWDYEEQEEYTDDNEIYGPTSIYLSNE